MIPVRSVPLIHLDLCAILIVVVFDPCPDMFCERRGANFPASQFIPGRKELFWCFLYDAHNNENQKYRHILLIKKLLPTQI